ncbi:MAG: inositol monophosphatase [Alphaproteobacteria bacterium]|nr:inositol monophosphatase [Alphaproteobacteria bacterium]
MLSNIINSKSIRNEILHFIVNILIDVNQKVVLNYFNKLTPKDIDIKSSNDDFVSVADKMSEDYISQKLSNFLDNTKIIGEETAFLDKKNFLSLLNEPLLWVIDPIDGTKNYINGNENFCSMISLVEHSFPIASFIYKPLQRQFIYAFKDIGAYIFDVETKISTKLNLELDSFSQIIGSGGTKGIPEVFRKSILSNLRSFTKRVFVGSAGIETMMLVTNKIQFVFHGRVTPWDHSPLDLIIKEAGGCVYMARFKEEFNIKSKGPILAATNSKIWDEVREIAIPKSNLYRKRLI